MDLGKTLCTFVCSSSRVLLTWLGLVPDLDQLLLPPAVDLRDVQHALHHPRHQRALQLAPGTSAVKRSSGSTIGFHNHGNRREIGSVTQLS